MRAGLWALAAILLGAMLAHLLLATGQFEDALSVASLLDHRQPVTYPLYQRESLLIRMEAATAIGWPDLAEQYRTRLLNLLSP